MGEVIRPDAWAAAAGSVDLEAKREHSIGAWERICAAQRRQQTATGSRRPTLDEILAGPDRGDAA